MRVGSLLAVLCLALVAAGCGGSDSEDAGSAPPAAEGPREFKGVLPEPRFATPGKAAYCSDRETSQEDLGPTLFCWTPRDGLGVAIAWNGERATTDVYDEPPRVVHGIGVLKGYAPDAEPLPFGQRWVYRCTDTSEIATCRPEADGKLAFTCVSEKTRLTCMNAVGHGFSADRSGGHRLF